MIDAMKRALKVLENKKLRMDEHLIPIVVDDLRQAIEQAEKEATLQEISDIGQEIERPVKSYTGGYPQYATDDMSTKPENIDTSAEYVHEIDKSIYEDDDTQEYKRPWVGMSDVEIAIYSSGFSGIRLAREIEAQLKERNT
jgi:hypothetical protein